MKYMIDHAIAIPASSAQVWGVISDLTKNPVWQYDCERVAFLTSLRSGKGTRLRMTYRNGREIVMEITAWYNGVGYEYQIVDGVSYVPNLGRLRMQQATEGTIVQWLFQYDLGGMLSGVRNSISTRRNIERPIIESLRDLYGYMRDNHGIGGDVLEDAPSAMKPGISAEERQAYQPKYPSAYQEDEVGDVSFEAFGSEDFAPSSVIDEPAFLEDDTRPNPILSDESSWQASDSTRDDEHDLYRPERAMASDDVMGTKAYPDAVVNHDVRETDEANPAPAVTSIPYVNPRDTAQVSVFDLFNLPRPSQTQEAVRVADDDKADDDTDENIVLSTQESPSVSSEMVSGWGRSGLRSKLRKHLLNLRYPS